MPAFTDTELQKKFCEGFSFFPFKYLEQHDTLIYKCYTGKDDLRKLLEWHSREHDSSHYSVKITKKLKHTDIPAAEELLQLLQQAGEWCTARAFAAKLHPAARKLTAGIGKCHSLVAAYLIETLRPVAAKLADKYLGTDVEGVEQIERTIQAFIRSTDEPYALLKTLSSKKTSASGRSFGEEDREYLSKITAAMEIFQAHQTRNIDLLDAWKHRQMIHNNCRALN
ncbi:hypothetical protein ACFOTA_03795 [Chitinophaga sp. GCM10012297]|uniref:Uncharacterized protein n=1 Tax=Chitinophaga chungangae TaxID=2821488 RepID=A0ABS3Y9K1_9BACT|nr:hypothetical protein [Chitinophaga chungangae]MBO9151316.1 hypothetical protein [Chitinophaga chungangae]